MRTKTAGSPKTIAVTEHARSEMWPEQSGNVPSKWTLNVLKTVRSQNAFYRNNTHATADGTEISSQPSWRAVCVPRLRVGRRHIIIPVNKYPLKQVWSE